MRSASDSWERGTGRSILSLNELSRTQIMHSLRGGSDNIEKSVALLLLFDSNRHFCSKSHPPGSPVISAIDVLDTSK